MDLRMKTKHVFLAYFLAAVIVVGLALIVFYGIQNRRLNNELNRQKIEYNENNNIQRRSKD